MIESKNENNNFFGGYFSIEKENNFSEKMRTVFWKKLKWGYIIKIAIWGEIKYGKN